MVYPSVASTWCSLPAWPHGLLPWRRQVKILKFGLQTHCGLNEAVSYAGGIGTNIAKTKFCFQSISYINKWVAGEWQPGCSDNLVTGSPGCSHGRSIRYYYWSIIQISLYPIFYFHDMRPIQDCNKYFVPINIIIFIDMSIICVQGVTF